jgi:hypothetical protein
MRMAANNKQFRAQAPFGVRTAAGLLLASLVLAGCGQLGGQSANNISAAADTDWKPKFTADGALELPKNFREWVFIGAPLTPNALNGGKAPFPEYHNVYIHKSVLAQYQKTGVFPEGTILFKELQLTQPSTDADGAKVEASGRGFFPGAYHGADVSVKDSTRFKDTNGWGFFNFGHHAPPYEKTAKAMPAEACAGCHTANAQKDMVFTQFYTLLQREEPAAKAK